MKLIHLALCLTCAIVFDGCATNTNDPTTNARSAATKAALLEAGKVLGQEGVNALLRAGQREMAGGKQDLGSSAAAGVWSVVDFGALYQGISHAVSAYSAGQLPATAATAGKVAQQAVASGQSPQKVTSAVAAVISTAAGAPPQP